MNQEIQSVIYIQVLILAKWIYKTKLGTFGEIEKLKALVVLVGARDLRPLWFMF
jgi:hypothetical protein